MSNEKKCSCKSNNVNTVLLVIMLFIFGAMLFVVINGVQWIMNFMQNIP